MANDRQADQRALYVISVAAELAGVHPQTLRIYERKGLIEPSRTEGRSRRYSDRDIALLQRIQELTNDGVSLAGVRKILDLEAELDQLRQRIGALDAALAAAHEAHEVAVRDVHRSYRRDLVPVSRAVVRVPRRCPTRLRPAPSRRDPGRSMYSPSTRPAPAEAGHPEGSAHDPHSCPPALARSLASRPSRSPSAVPSVRSSSTAGPASADTITVTNTADDGPTSTRCAACSSTPTTATSIVLTAGATYQLTSVTCRCRSAQAIGVRPGQHRRRRHHRGQRRDDRADLSRHPRALHAGRHHPEQRDHHRRRRRGPGWRPAAGLQGADRAQRRDVHRATRR